MMEDCCDGLQFKNHPLYSCEPQALQIMLYYDEVELCNPLGAAKKIHKVGMYYSLYNVVYVFIGMISHRNVLLSAGKPFP